MFSDSSQEKLNSNYVMLSSLNHYSYCPRRCFLIYVEGVFVENEFTLDGKFLHNRVDSGIRSTHDGIIEHRRIHLISHRLQVYGIADLIEESNGHYCPVEYKRGRRAKWVNDELQLCAQALCLEEMLQIEPLSQGVIYYGESARRLIVKFTSELRKETETTINNIHTLQISGKDPDSSFLPKCSGCSLYDICLPKETAEWKKLEKDSVFEEQE